MGSGESEDDSPIPRYRYGSKATPIALQRMQLQARQGHPVRRPALVEVRQDQPNAIGAFGWHRAAVSVLEESPQTVVPKAPDHVRL
jgi:hypothetical protein